MTPFVKKIEAGSVATAAKAFHKLWGQGAWDDLPAEQRAYIMERITLIPRGDSLIMEDRFGLLEPGRLEELDMPVTFVDGGDSHPAMAQIIAALGKRIPDAEWLSVEGAGHMLPMTHPKKLVEAVKGRFLI